MIRYLIDAQALDPQLDEIVQALNAGERIIEVV